VSFGKVCYIELEVEAEDGTKRMVRRPVIDHGPKMQAINTLVRLEQQRAKLFGLEAPERRVVNVITEEVVQQWLADAEQEYQELLCLSTEDERAIDQHLKGAS
jgi:hypothetical protein